MIANAQKAGVEFMVTCATMEDNFAATAQLARENTAILPCFGIHPWFIDSRSENWKDILESALNAMPSGVGETGIDFTARTADRQQQLAVFETHLDLARQLKRPINIHVRKAWDTFIHTIKRFGPLEVPGVIHAYSGSADMISLFEKYNWYVSFAGSVTNPDARKVVESLKTVSQDRFVMETDTPDIYPRIPDPAPDRINEPANLPLMARIAASRINMDEEIFCDLVYENSQNCFEPLIKGRQ